MSRQAPAPQTTPEDYENLSRMVHYAQVYAQNRTGRVIVALSAFLLLWVALSGGVWAGALLMKAGHGIAAALVLTLATLAYLAMLFFALNRRGQAQLDALATKLFEQPGQATVAARRPTSRWIGLVLGLFLVTGVAGTVILGFAGILPDRYMMPVGALYVVPFLVFLVLWQRPAISYWALLWPSLYAIHAALLLLVPSIPASGPWMQVHMLTATCGYGLLAAAIALVHGRLALRRLQTLSRQGLVPEDAGHE